MVDKTGLKNVLTRLASGIVFLCAYVFMSSEISTLVNQVIIWVTGMVFVLYGFVHYRELKTIRAGTPEQPDPQKQKWQLLDTIKIPLLGVFIIALYYFSNQVLALVFYWIAGLWLFFSGLIRCIKLFIHDFSGKSGQEA